MIVLRLRNAHTTSLSYYLEPWGGRPTSCAMEA